MPRVPSLGILMIASEVAPWAKTGGLADVLGGLPSALDDLGHRVTVILPKYRGMKLPETEVISGRVRVGNVAYELTWHVAELPRRRRVVFVDYAPFFDRPGYYGTAAADYPDNDRRFALLAAAALDFAHLHLSDRVDIVHAHDWQ